jgi:murein DD-endopeptidase MepM/ murein hydrolase activator NlpD
MFILKGWVKLTKDYLKPLKIILLSILFLALVIFIKYKPVYTVTVSGKILGYVTDKKEIDNKLNEYINHREGNIALIDIENMPEYSFELVSRNKVTKENEILEKIESTAVITYRTYAITVNGETIDEVSTKIEAEDIISNLKSDLKEGVEFELGIVEVFKNEETAISSDEAFNELNEIKLAKTTEYEEEQARIEAERIAAEQEAARQAAIQAQAAQAAQMALANSVGSGNVNGLAIVNPLKTSYLITSRFGEVSRSRSSSHTGLDMATSLGTPIYPIASGTVTFAGLQGSYGNLVIVDHGDGVQSWYAHCNTINVEVGTEVTVDTNIATVGSTGNSTGPHLHLEIRVNGSAINPQNYLY